MSPDASVLCLFAGAFSCVFGGLFAFLYFSYSGMAQRKEQQVTDMRGILARMEMLQNRWSVNAHLQIPAPKSVKVSVSEVGYLTLEMLRELDRIGWLSHPHGIRNLMSENETSDKK